MKSLGKRVNFKNQHKSRQSSNESMSSCSKSKQIHQNPLEEPAGEESSMFEAQEDTEQVYEPRKKSRDNQKFPVTDKRGGKEAY